MEYSKNLKTLRQQRGITQQQLADYLCVDKTSISKWEHGANYPNQNIQVMIADYFGVSIDYLLGREEKQYSVNVSSEAQLLIDKISTLSDEEVAKAKEYLDFIISQRK